MQPGRGPNFLNCPFHTSASDPTKRAPWDPSQVGHTVALPNTGHWAPRLFAKGQSVTEPGSCDYQHARCLSTLTRNATENRQEQKGPKEVSHGVPRLMFIRPVLVSVKL